jgi:hypothetical protein
MHTSRETLKVVRSAEHIQYDVPYNLFKVGAYMCDDLPTHSLKLCGAAA